MDRYRGGDGHYADVECAYGELERYLVLSFNEEARYWKEEGHQTEWPTTKRAPRFTPKGPDISPSVRR
jgi:hypothetical protein